MLNHLHNLNINSLCLEDMSEIVCSVSQVLEDSSEVKKELVGSNMKLETLLHYCWAIMVCCLDLDEPALRMIVLIKIKSAICFLAKTLYHEGVLKALLDKLFSMHTMDESLPNRLLSLVCLGDVSLKMGEKEEFRKLLFQSTEQVMQSCVSAIDSNENHLLRAALFECIGKQISTNPYIYQECVEPILYILYKNMNEIVAGESTFDTYILLKTSFNILNTKVTHFG